MNSSVYLEENLYKEENMQMETGKEWPVKKGNRQ